MTTILVVEDMPDNRLVFEDMFAFDDIGADLAIVPSAEEALAKLDEIRPILVLMDVGLPGMSGLDAARIIKNDPQTRNIAIWAITAHAMDAAEQEAIAAGCDRYVSKPINAADLADRLRAFALAGGKRKTA
jgi:CheY-like chemotaxis protein